MCIRDSVTTAPSAVSPIATGVATAVLRIWETRLSSMRGGCVTGVVPVNCVARDCERVIGLPEVMHASEGLETSSSAGDGTVYLPRSPAFHRTSQSRL